AEKDVREQFRNLGYEQEADEIEVHIAKGSSYPNEIAKATEDAHLLVIGHRCKNRFLSAFIDSVDKRVADLVSCPVLLVPYKKSRRFSLLYTKNQEDNKPNGPLNESGRSKSFDQPVPSKIPA
ncbi:universal stress protein, partial [candidate division KSB1 bacterium]|nr:universal stress protein [candidate division KSB1 bacterium]NIR72300.1 universal stress protein [candidate division KSB1 bacterium]NIS26692.1 universal stress protein [candidate division KSB1 bacterium]NIT70328.1 universal stress protein [candidate division KSB1 bacterium]NIU27307.1 universal stress protein [candidate division KSB1 bacterium]